MPMSTKRKAPAKLAKPVAKSSAKIPTKNTIDESHTSVSGADALQGANADTIEISSDADSDEYTSEDDADVKAAQTNGGSNGAKAATAQPEVNGKPTKAAVSTDAADDADSDDEATSPSFGELLRGNEAIDVSALLQQTISPNTVSQPAKTTIVPPSHQSLTTVLTQALKTDDTELLESCLHTTDLVTIRNTIERIDSNLAGILLNKLASRLYRRPGRAGNLMTWVQWTLIAHGGALPSQSNVLQGLNGLQKVLSERAKGLNSLLALKGKLDLLEGQMDLRRKMQRSSGLIKGDESDDEDEDENVIWVEGETEGDSVVGGRKRSRDEVDDGAPMTNGLMGDSDDDGDDVDDVEDDDEDDAAEESLDEDEVQYDDVDDSMGEDEESDAEPAPPSKLQKVAGFFKRK